MFIEKPYVKNKANQILFPCKRKDNIGVNKKSIPLVINSGQRKPQPINPRSNTEGVFRLRRPPNPTSFKMFFGHPMKGIIKCLSLSMKGLASFIPTFLFPIVLC